MKASNGGFMQGVKFPFTSYAGLFFVALAAAVFIGSQSGFEGFFAGFLFGAAVAGALVSLSRKDR